MKTELSKNNIRIGIRIRRTLNHKKKVYRVLGPDTFGWGWRIGNDYESLTIYNNEFNEWEIVK